jgi:hypothetical protein
MKKTAIIVILALFGIAQAQAQVSFKPGIRGGLNFSHFTNDVYDDNNGYYDVDGNYIIGDGPNFDSKTDFYLGFFGALKLTRYYTLQPEIDYSNQGTTYKEFNNSSAKLNVSYLSISVVNKFTFTDKFNVHVGPTIDFVVDKNFDVDNEIDLAFQLGAGYNFTPNFGIEARVKKGIVPVLWNSGYDHTNVVFSLGATYAFDVK